MAGTVGPLHFLSRGGEDCHDTGISLQFLCVSFVS